MRILHVVPTYLPATRYGGPIHSVHGLCSALARLGHEVHVFTTSVDGAGDSDVPHGQPVVLDGVSVWYFRSQFLRRLYWSPALGRALRAQLPRFALAHLHSVFLWPTAAAARAARGAGVPYVISPRGMLVSELIRRKSALPKAAWLAAVEARNLAGAAAIHVTSRRELDDARALPLLRLPQPFVVPNGVTPPAVDARARCSARVQRVCDGPAFALCLGRIHWKKGLDRALRAIAGTDVRLVICGNDEEGHRAELERVIDSAGLRAQVSFEDPVEGDDKWALLSACRFAVLSSLNENFGNVVTEAMVAGRPVVVTDTVGAADLVEQAGAGLVCAGDDAALRGAMLQLWRSPAEADRMGEAGRAFAGRELLWDRCAEQMSLQYAKIAREGG